MSFNTPNRSGSPLGGATAAASATSPSAAGSRRSITIPSRFQPPPETIEEQPEETLFEHPKATVYQLSKPPILPSSIPSASPQSPGSSPWKTGSDTMIGVDRPLSLKSPSQSAPYIKFRDSTIPMMPNTSMWCVDEQSIFVTLKNRIELPFESDEDKKLVEDFKEALKKIIQYEATPCPFKRLVEAPAPQPEEVGSPQRRPTRKLIGKKREFKRQELDGAPSRRYSDDPRSINYRRSQQIADAEDEDDDEDLESEGPEGSYFPHDDPEPMASIDGQLDNQTAQELPKETHEAKKDSETSSSEESDDSEEESEDDDDDDDEDEDESDEDEDGDEDSEDDDDDSSNSLDETSFSRNNETVSSSSEPLAALKLQSAEKEKQAADIPSTQSEIPTEELSEKIDEEIVEPSVLPGPPIIPSAVEDEHASQTEETDTILNDIEATQPNLEVIDSSRQLSADIDRQLSHVEVAAPTADSTQPSAEPSSEPSKEPSREAAIEPSAEIQPQEPPMQPVESTASNKTEDASESTPSFSQPEVPQSLPPTILENTEQPILRNLQKAPPSPPATPPLGPRQTDKTPASSRHSTPRDPNAGLITRLIELLTSPPSELFDVVLEFLRVTCTRLLRRTEIPGGIATSLRLRSIPGRWIDSEDNSEADSVTSGAGQAEGDGWDSDADTDDYGVPLGNDSPGRNGRARWGNATGARRVDAVASGTDARE